MDPIEKLNAMSTKKLANNKDLNLRGEALKSMGSSSQENFFRKSQKNFSLSKSEAYGTIIQIMKTDIFQIQELINEFSYITKMFKLSSRNLYTSKKITEIDENRNVKALIDRINEEASTPEKLGKTYACTNANELVMKMGVELSLYETFIKKINELFFILNLKFSGEENSMKLSQESFSKFLVVKLAVERMMEKSQTTYINDTDTSLNSSLMNNSQNNFNQVSTNASINANAAESSNNIFENEKNKKIDEYEKIKLVTNVNDLLSLESKGENDRFAADPLVKHLCAILRDFLGKLSFGYSDLLAKYAIKKEAGSNLINLNCDKNNLNISMESLFSQKLLLEKLLMEKDKLINSNSSYNLTGASIAKDSSKDKEIDELVDKPSNEKKRIEAELELAKIQNEKYLKEIKMITDKLNEQKSKYEEEIAKLRKGENKEKHNQEKEISNLYTIDESNRKLFNFLKIDFINRNFQEAIEKNVSKLYQEVKKIYCLFFY